MTARAKLHLCRTVIVEGRYDKIALAQVLDAHIVTTEGFGIFRRADRVALLRRMAAQHGVIVLTDSDGGGRQIRSFLTGVLPKDQVIQLYIPRIPGKERRKPRPGKSGTLGVEGMDADLLYRLFAPYACDTESHCTDPVTKADFYRDGLSGGPGAADRRAALAAAAELPGDLSANALLEAVNLLGGAACYRRLLAIAGLAGHPDPEGNNPETADAAEPPECKEGGG